MAQRRPLTTFIINGISSGDMQEFMWELYHLQQRYDCNVKVASTARHTQPRTPLDDWIDVNSHVLKPVLDPNLWTT